MLKMWLRKLFRKRPPASYRRLVAKDGSIYWLAPLPERITSEAWAAVFPEYPKDFKLLGREHIALAKVIPETEDVWTLKEIYVRKPHRHLGLATQLLAHVQETARAANIRWIIAQPIAFEDPEPNFDLIGWYLHRGFRLGTLPRDDLLHHRLVCTL